MMNMYFSVLNCSTGFPEVAAIKLIPFRDLGDLEKAVNECIDQFDAFANKYSSSAPFHEHHDDLMQLAARIEHRDQIVSSTASFRREDGKLVQRILSVSVRAGEDLPTRRY